MKSHWRLVVFAAVLGVLILLGLVFAPFVVDTLLMPLATTLWLLLRLFVLSIHQKYFWTLLIFAMIVWALYRLSPQLQVKEEEPDLEFNATLDEIRTWRIDLINSPTTELGQFATRRELVRMLVSLYLPRQHGAIYMDVEADLKEGRIPLPENLYTFLFPKETPADKRPLLRELRKLSQAPARLLRRWTGREAADYYRAVDDVLSFIENSLETEYGR